MSRHESSTPRSRRTSTVESHAAGAGEVMALGTLLLNQLLGCDIAGCEENRRRHTLSEQWPGSQPGVVPVSQSAVNSRNAGSFVDSPSEECDHDAGYL